MQGVPLISHILCYAEGGIDTVVQSLRGYDEEDAQAFIEKYDAISPSDREKLTIEEIATAAGIRTLDLLAVATKALFIENQTISAIIAATSHPKVVEKSVAMAKQPGGVRDREMLHTAMGFLPAPKGATFITNRIQVANFDGKAPQSEESEPDIAELPPMDDDVLGLEAIEKKLLQAKN